MCYQLFQRNAQPGTLLRGHGLHSQGVKGDLDNQPLTMTSHIFKPVRALQHLGAVRNWP